MSKKDKIFCFDICEFEWFVFGDGMSFKLFSSDGKLVEGGNNI